MASVRTGWAAALAAGLLFAGLGAAAAATAGHRTLCDDNAPTCTEPAYAAYSFGHYVGHDEPSLLFYSNTPGAGSSSRYLLRLPEEPPIPPRPNGAGGTFNFQLRAAFWFGMAMCDTQSAPSPGTPCPPADDANIFDNPDPNAADYVGRHPGTAFMELQFYPPGWVLLPDGISCDPLRWCAALNIDSLSADLNTGAVLNRACRQLVGAEYVNFAFITRNGRPQAPANPVAATDATYAPDPRADLLMRSGDLLVVDLRDTPQGLAVVILDLTSGQSGSMVASAANGFGQVAFAPAGQSCDNIPYDFHPIYATSSEHTRVPWAAHSYNIAFSDEIGHFENCAAVDALGNCRRAGVGEDGSPDPDDSFCFPASASSRIPIAGCVNSDIDFGGPSYRDTWPGSRASPDAGEDRSPRPVLFSSPLFQPTGAAARLRDYDRVAFETDLPNVEGSIKPRCSGQTGQNCTVPPPGARFYPFYSTRRDAFGCLWQMGGALIPGTREDFGGSAAAEYGDLLAIVFPGPRGPTTQFSDFRRILPRNPCRAIAP